ncbi:MAG: hypothetical protein ACRD3L_09475 [Terriglobales bacterium]
MKKVWLVCLAVCLLVCLAGLAVAADSSTVNGTVSDSICGAKGANANHAACMNKCLGKGAKAVIVTDGDGKVLTVDNADVLKGHEGHHVAVTGEVTGDSIHIDSLKML